MSDDAAVAAVYAIANALHCRRIARDRHPIVMRTNDAAALLATIRTVSAAAGMALHVERDVAGADLSSPAHVVAVTGTVDAGHAGRIVDAVARTDRDVAIIVVVPEAERDAALGMLGEAMIEAGTLERDEELLPRQMVPSSFA